MNDKIEDNSSYKKLKEEIEGAEAFRLLANFLPLSELDIVKFKKVFDPLDDIKQQFEITSKAPDKFNHHFANRGWIAHESINEKLLFSCIELAETGKVAEAEQELIEYYSSDKMKWLKDTSLIT